MTLKIAVYAISKNEQQFVERFIKSAEDADCIVIADTGSTDDTAVVAKEFGATVYNIAVTPWRFDIARDAALVLIPRDIDVCISLDLDEVLEPGWREEIERVWVKGQTTRLRYKFDWGCGISFYYEKIHARNGYHWHHPVHEYPVPDLRTTEIYAQTDKLLVSHHPDPTKSRSQYMDLLKLAVTEDSSCPRNAFYYARELTFYHKWVDAIVALFKYLDNPRANWPNERCYAYRLLGKSYENLNQSEEALKYYTLACKEAPKTREPWIEKALCHYTRKEWQKCLLDVQQALTIVDKELVYTMDPSVWGSKPHDLLAISAYHLGDKSTAIKHGKIASELEPDNTRLKNNLVFYMA
jgi:glycosyltransferase involved in cell wall biosynthesis